MSSQKSFLRGRRVLIADDEQFSRFFVVRMARDFGCDDILQAADGADAMSKLETGGESLSAIILDFNMPDANGLQILKRIRTGKAGVPRDANVLMLTGSSDFGLVGTAMSLDVDAFLIKPVSEAILGDRLRRIFDEKKDYKSVADYEAVDVEELSKRLLAGSKPIRTPEQMKQRKEAVLAAVAKTTAAAAAPKPGIKRIAFASLEAGAVLAENIRGPNGELLLGAATVLSERLLNRLRELQSVLKLENIAVFEHN
jgi:YesN/AraC family two-component response regulator